MTDNTEPTIDKIFDAIEIFEGDDSNGKEYQVGYNDMVLACRLMKEQIRIEVKQAVSDQVAKAKQELLSEIMQELDEEYQPSISDIELDEHRGEPKPIVYLDGVKSIITNKKEEV